MDKKEFLISTFNKESITIIDVLEVEYPKSKGYKIENNLITWWWEENQDTQPTESELESHLTALKNDWGNYQYARDRQREYPALNDQFDMMYHDLDSWKSTILAIKIKYPKGE